MTSKVTHQYTLIGAGTGLFLACFGTLCLSLYEFGDVFFSSIANVQNEHYLLWILDTSPLWLGMLAWLAGQRQDELQEQNSALRNQLMIHEKKEENLGTRLNNILDSAANEIFICRLQDFKIVQVSGGIIKNLGYSQAELTEMHLYELFEDLDQKKLTDLTAPLLSGSPTPVELYGLQKKKDGASFPVEFELTLDSPDSPEFMTGVAGNFSNQTIYREALQRERKKFFDILENLPIAFHLQAQDYSVPYANKMFRERFGDPDVKPCYALMHNREAPCEICQPFQVFRTEEEITSIWNSQDGKTYFTMCTPYIDIDQRPLVMEMALDITEMEQAKETAIQALEEAKKANKAKTEFLTNMSHELRTPLNAILGFGHLLELGKDSIARKHHGNIDLILKSGNHLLDLINDVLDMIRVDFGKTALELQPINLEVFISDLIQILHPMAKNKEVSLNFSSEKDPVVIDTDEMRLKQIVLNLISNAIHFNKTGGTVNIRLNKPEKNQIKIDIEDTGNGIPDDALESIFDHFPRGPQNTRLKENGTGMGLSIVKSLLELLGGSIRVTSKIGQGSCFSIVLPANHLEPSGATKHEISSTKHS